MQQFTVADKYQIHKSVGERKEVKLKVSIGRLLYMTLWLQIRHVNLHDVLYHKTSTQKQVVLVI